MLKQSNRLYTRFVFHAPETHVAEIEAVIPTFNVKRLRPIELGPFDYENEPHTPSLWISEGMTSYYAALMLARAGLSNLGSTSGTTAFQV